MPTITESCPTCGTELSPATDSSPGVCRRCVISLLMGGDEQATAAPAPAEPVLSNASDLYEIVREIGRGGSGTVFLATEKRIGRQVALKLLNGLRAHDEASEARFQAEVEAIASLNHPNVVQVYDSGEMHGRAYFTMRFLPNGSLAEHFDDFSDPHKVTKFMRALAHAVYHAHERGVLHRDLKPSNILLDKHNAPYLTDFGLAKRQDHEIELTLDGAIMGTPAYMSPEQARGENVQLTTASDIFSLGAIFYQILTQRLPFEGKTSQAIIHNLLESEASFTKDDLDKVDRDLATICLKCLEKEPAKRYPSALALAQDLERWQRKEPVLARPVSTSARFWRWCKRKPAIATLSAIAILAVLGGTLISLLLLRESETKQAEIQRLLYYANMVLLDTETEHSSGSIESRLGEVATSPDGAFEWYYWQDYHQDSARWVIDFIEEFDGVAHAPKTGVAFTPDGKFVAAGGAQGPVDGVSKHDVAGVVHLWDLSTGQRVETFTGHPGMVGNIRFTPDGKHVIATGSETISVWDRTDGQRVGQFEHDEHAQNGSIYALDLVPGAPSQIATSSWGHTIVIREFPSGSLVRQFTPVGGPSIGSGMAVSPDGKTIATHPGTIWDFKTGQLRHDFGPIWNDIGRLAYAPDGCNIAFRGSVYDTESGEVTFAHSKPKAHFNPVFSPDGHWFASFFDRSVNLQSMTGGAHRQLYHVGSEGALDLAFSPDNQWLALTARDGKLRLWPRESWDRSLPGHGSRALGNHRIPAVSISSDGRRMLTGANDQRARVWNADTHELLLTVHAHSAPVSTVAFFPDGREFLTASNDGTAKVWDAASGRMRLSLTEHTDELWCAAVSHDGTRIVTGGLDKTAIIWEAATGWKLFTLTHPDAVSAIAFSPDDQLLVTGGDDKKGRLWNARTGEELVVLGGHASWVAEAVFFPDGQRVLTASADSTVRMWDVATGELQRTFNGHTAAVGALGVSPDGRRLFSGSMDGTVRVWDPERERHVLTLESAYGPVHALALSPDGTRLLAGAHYAAPIWTAPRPPMDTNPHK